MALSLWQLVQFTSGLVMVAALVAAVALGFWMVGWVALALVSVIPIIGRRGRHARWSEFNGRGRDLLSPTERAAPVPRHRDDQAS